ncbi:tetratricopeptide (TPR) repeat protein [Nonomuraea thailandensis]|uniref:Tetratricopeptide (TPR) repeat protein n=1 Tax=Nonomuraea thailandensis TaxID=1188745 RepID=A0A9X2GFS4_9ACTN|nr:AAA family ATPase [Nonomuraea thailandensis]MCP2357722.1 tetratricopeptide (TPR) repeat protein [Nonomuraea thailandensis]
MAMLIGRERPAAVLRGEVERALASHGALVLVTGEAGIGKSALVASAAQEAVRGGARLLTGACWEGEGAPGYWPWVQVVRQLAPGATPQSLAGAEAEAFQLYDAVTALLVDASREQPVVVVLEDLHWADTASLRLLEFVVRHAWFERLLVIGTYRDAEVDGPLSLPLEAKATTLTLAGLDLGGVERLVALTTGVAPEAGLVAEIHQRTGGNPFFVEQTARLWQGGSPLATIPPGVGAAIRRRLSRLAGGVLDTLRMAAVLGREFTEESLVRALTHASSPVAGARRGSAVPGPGPAHGDGVTATAHAAAGGAAPELARTRPDDLMGARPRPDDLTGARPLSDGGSPPARRGGPAPVSPGFVRKALDQAVSAKLVVSRGSGHHAFVHDLVRETLYAELGEPSRAALHASALAALDTALPAVRAHHAYLAAVPGAADLLLAAARDAEGRMAYEEAAGHFRRALDLTPPSGLRRRATIGLDLGVARHRAGDTAAGVRSLEAALALTHHLDHPDLLAIAALKLHDLCSTGQGRWTGFVHEAHRKLVRRATPAPPPQTTPWPAPPAGANSGLGAGPAVSAGAQAPAGKGPGVGAGGREGGGPEAVAAPAGGEDRLHVAARELTAVAADLARQGADDEALGYSLMSRLGVIWGPGTTAERLAITDELSAVAGRTGDDQLGLTARSWRIGALLELGDPRCLTEQHAFTAWAESSGLALFRHEAAVLKAAFATLTGRFDEADTCIDAAYDLGEQPGIGRRDLRWMQRWSAALLRGRFDVADTVLTEMRHAGSQHFPLYQAVTAVQRGGGSEAAMRHLAQIMAAGEQYLRWMAPLWLRFQAQAAARSKDPVLCEHARAAISPYVGQWGVTATVAVEGPYAHWAAVLDAAQERWDDAVAGFTAAYQAADVLGARPWSVESRARLAEVLQARGDDASALIEQVEREAAELGMLVRLPSPGAAAFRFDGEVWALTFADRTVHLPDSKGLADLRVLLDRPGSDVPAVELLNPPGGQVVIAARGMGGDDVLDAEARKRYRRRLELLDEEIDRAVELGEERRAAEYDAERQALLDELRTAAGLGGRPRRLGDEAERARKAVTNRIRNTLRQLDQRHPELAAHLRASVSTGSACRYQPASEVRWST